MCPLRQTGLLAEGDLDQIPQLDPGSPPRARLLLRLPPTAKLLSERPAPVASPHSPATRSPAPTTATHEGHGDLVVDTFPTLFLVVNSLDPLRYLAVGTLASPEMSLVAVLWPRTEVSTQMGTFSFQKWEEQL